MIYDTPRWDKLFLQVRAFGSCSESPKPLSFPKFPVWGDTEDELMEYAQECMSVIIHYYRPYLIECRIWKGTPSPATYPIKEWNILTNKLISQTK